MLFQQTQKWLDVGTRVGVVCDVNSRLIGRIGEITGVVGIISPFMYEVRLDGLPNTYLLLGSELTVLGEQNQGSQRS